MNKRKWTIALPIIALLVAFIVLSKAFYIVRPDQFAVVTAFGDPIDEKHEPGLYVLIPFFQDVRFLDSRVRGWDDIAKNTNTSELKPIDFTVFARWHVDGSQGGPTRFYTAVGDDRRAHASMDSVVTKRIQAAIREHRLASIVRDQGRSFGARATSDLRFLFVDYPECQPEKNAEIQTMLQEYQDIAKAVAGTVTEQAKALRTEIVQEILRSSNEILFSEFGIRILDLHFKYLNYSPQVHDEITTKITKDRARDIARYNKLGSTCTGTIRRVKEQQLGHIVGERDRTVRELDGEAVAMAIKIKADAFSSDPDFFRFTEILELYREGLGKGTKMVMSTDSPLMQLMQDPSLLATAPKKAAPVEKSTPK
jgi:membrane protease subunit HflC